MRHLSVIHTHCAYARTHTECKKVKSLDINYTFCSQETASYTQHSQSFDSLAVQNLSDLHRQAAIRNLDHIAGLQRLRQLVIADAQLSDP